MSTEIQHIPNANSRVAVLHKKSDLQHFTTGCGALCKSPKLNVPAMVMT